MARATRSTRVLGRPKTTRTSTCSEQLQVTGPTRAIAPRLPQVFSFLSATLPSYGKVREDGSPVDPTTYDYRRAAWDAVHFPALLDRFWQNLRRAEGWNIQYFGSVEPQRRLAPHAHFAVRGTIPKKVLREVAAATYHQVWWPSTDGGPLPEPGPPADLEGRPDRAAWRVVCGPRHRAAVAQLG